MIKMMSIKLSPTLMRWVDVILLTITAVSFYTLFQSLFKIETIFIRIEFIFISWPSWLQIFTPIFLSGLLWFLLIRIGGFRLSDLIFLSFLRYHPVWFIALLGTVVNLFLTSLPIDWATIDFKSMYIIMRCDVKSGHQMPHAAICSI
jgi:hypothetical protein